MSHQNQSDMIMRATQVCGCNLMGYILLEIEQFTGRQSASNVLLVFVGGNRRSRATLLGTPCQHQATITDVGGASFPSDHQLFLNCAHCRYNNIYRTCKCWVLIAKNNLCRFFFLFSSEKQTRKPICVDVSV